MTAMLADYRPFLADWIWNVVLPTLAYVCLLAAAILMTAHPIQSLYIVAGAALLLLTIGIHNAWDVVVWFTTERHAHPERQHPEVRAGRKPSEQ